MALRETQVMVLGISDSLLFGEAVTSPSEGIVRGDSREVEASR